MLNVLTSNISRTDPERTELLKKRQRQKIWDSLNSVCAKKSPVDQHRKASSSNPLGRTRKSYTKESYVLHQLFPKKFDPLVTVCKLKKEIHLISESANNDKPKNYWHKDARFVEGKNMLKSNNAQVKFRLMVKDVFSMVLVHGLRGMHLDVWGPITPVTSDVEKKLW